MLGIGLALAAALSLGVVDFLAGVKSRQLGVTTVLLISEAVGLGAIALVVLVHGLHGDWSFVPWAALVGLAQIGFLTAFWQGMTVGAMGVVAPITATGTIIPLLFGLARGEHPSALQVVGIVVALLGVVLAAYDPGGPKTETGGRGRVAAGVGLALLAAVASGLFVIATSLATDHGDAISVTFVMRVTLVGVVWAAVLGRGGRPSFERADVPILVVIGVLETIGIVLFAAATTKALISIVSVVVALYPLGPVLLARLVLGERVHAIQRVGAGGALAGVALISAG
jgi:drug/metabolite transporter (DMT)-like permease